MPRFRAGARTPHALGRGCGACHRRPPRWLSFASTRVRRSSRLLPPWTATRSGSVPWISPAAVRRTPTDRRLAHGAQKPPFRWPMGEEQPLLGAGYYHVAEAPLLSQGGGISRAVAWGEDPAPAHEGRPRNSGPLLGAGSIRVTGWPRVLAVGVAWPGRQRQEASRALLAFLPGIGRAAYEQLLGGCAAVLRIIGPSVINSQVRSVAITRLHQLRGGRVLDACQIPISSPELQQSSCGAALPGNARASGIADHLPERQTQWRRRR